MPTFDFQCRKCNTMFEFSRPFGSADHPACPWCRSKKTEKLISPPSVMFKGTGFYKTDSVTKKPAKAPKKEEAPSKEKSANGAPKETAKKDTTKEKKP